ncbi:hypothetical protein [Ramlibacter albus]|uniref:Uncharacterized protein n=1 Tax=Ramlibacter albus TaxID=2079448 RepID=A0A923M9K6_9BURK|nr:hypothetical protein [Ramlibacter albus]MBC5765880.1 hypothetical protein [Ramlibacter albus]
MSSISSSTPPVTAAPAAPRPDGSSQAQFTQSVAVVTELEKKLVEALDEEKLDGDLLSGAGLLRVQLTMQALSVSVTEASTRAAALKKTKDDVLHNFPGAR